MINKLLSHQLTIKILEAVSYADIGKELKAMNLSNLSNASEMTSEEVKRYHCKRKA